jgi:site-specific DNA-methyltransferase (adenine-specific)
MPNSESSFSNIIKVATDKEDHGFHETQKPLQLMKLLISLVTPVGAIVLDPFVGSGTTCLAAKQLERHYIGIEIEAKYVHIAEARLADLSPIKLKPAKELYSSSYSLFDY